MDAATGEAPSTKKNLLEEYGVDLQRSLLLLFGVCMMFALVAVILYVCEYKRRKKLRLAEIARLQEEDPNAEIDIEADEFKAYVRRSINSIRDMKLPWSSFRLSKEIEHFKVPTVDGDSVTDPLTTLMIPLPGMTGVYPEASAERSFMSSEDRKERPNNNLVITPSSVENDEDRERQVLCDIAEAGMRSRRQLNKKKSEEKMTTQIEIVFSRDLDEKKTGDADAAGIADDSDSETWFAEKCVEIVPDNI